MAGKYIVRIYDKRTQETKDYRGPYARRREAEAAAERAAATYAKMKHIGVSIRD